MTTHQHRGTRDRSTRALALAAGLGLSLTACLTVQAGTTQPAGNIRAMTGKAYAPASGKLMYIESHWLFDDSGNPSRLVLYRCPDGKPFARKLVRDDGHPAQAPDFQLDDARRGYREGVRSSGNQRTVFVRDSAQASERSATLATTPLPVIDAGFDAYIRAHWDSLGKQDSNTVPFVIPSRLGTLNFSVKRLNDTEIDGRAARQYRLGLASWIGFALPHIDVAYDEKTHELLRFVGLANIRGDNGDNVRARISFDPSRDSTATPAELQQAEQAPLDGRCPIP